CVLVIDQADTGYGLALAEPENVRRMVIAKEKRWHTCINMRPKRRPERVIVIAHCGRCLALEDGREIPVERHVEFGAENAVVEMRHQMRCPIPDGQGMRCGHRLKADQ